MNRLVFISAFALVAAPVLAGCATNDTGGGGGGGEGLDLELTLGTLMPLTGALNNLGPNMQNGAKLAIKQVNDADVGLRITATHEDDKTTDTSAITNTFNRLVENGATAIAGPCCSGVTAAVLDLAVQNEVVVASPSATSPTLTERENEGFFWRMAPSDAVQGKVLAKLVADEGVRTVNLIAVNNAYGNGLAAVFTDTFTTSLSGVVTKTERYDEGAVDFQSQVTSACATPMPEGIVIVGYIDDGAAMLKEMQSQDCLSQVRVFGSEGVYDPGFVDKSGTDEQGNFLAAGVMGTTPEVAENAAWEALFENEYGEKPTLYAAESFDAVMYIALAAIQAESTEGRAMADAFLTIANPPGTTYTGDRFREAAQALIDGDDINYAGFAHDFEYSDKHEPTTGIFSVWRVTDEGELEIVQTGQDGT